MRKIFCSVALICAAVVAFGQQMPPIPIDPQVRIGQLENGLTYYVRHNEEPKGQANFYIAQKVGSILEDDDQRGLAHFLEHMCFNGTENFPGNGIIQYCQKIGVKFGADLNAYTSIDETVYNIDNVPVAKVPDAVDSCLLILHDWAGALLLEDEEIDKERGVIHEEWRSRHNAQMRMLDKILPEIYPGNKYGERMPIGVMEVVDNFPYDALRAYYKKWYRPDQQAIVVVGDIDVDEVEAKISSTFGSLPAAAADAAERYYLTVEPNEKPIISIATDKEQPYALTYLFAKHEAYPVEMKGDLNYYVYQYALNIAALVMDERLSDMAKKKDPDFIQAGIMDDDFLISKTTKAVNCIAVTDAKGVSRGLKSVYRELLRAVRNGFTAGEYDRARKELLSQVETQYKKRDKIKSASYCKEYVRHFIDNEPIPGIENEFALLSELAPNIPVELVNQVFASLYQEGNIAVAMMLPEKNDVEYPSAQEFADMLAAVEAEDIAPLEDKSSDKPLVKKLRKAGKVKSKEAADYGYTKYVLSNGATVYIKSTDYNKDQIMMTSYSWGGQILYPDSPTLKALGELVGLGGLGEFDDIELSKALAGKQANVNPYISMYTEGLRGSTTPKDFETFLQLVYLNHTALRQDQDAFESWLVKSEAALKNAEANPMNSLQDSLSLTLYNRDSRALDIKVYELADVDYKLALQIARERFANAADFSFVFTGMIDEQEALPLICKYIGSLPSNKKFESRSENPMKMFEGETTVQFERKMAVPMATNYFFYKGKLTRDLRNSLAYDIALQTLTITLLEEIREKEGGTYGIGAYGSLSSYPEEGGLMQIGYQTDPDKFEYLNGRVDEIVAEFLSNGPDEANVAKVKEYMVKKHQESLHENSYYQNLLLGQLQYGLDMETGYEEILESITCEDVRVVLDEVLRQGNLAKVIMVGVPEE